MSGTPGEDFGWQLRGSSHRRQGAQQATLGRPHYLSDYKERAPSSHGMYPRNPSVYSVVDRRRPRSLRHPPSFSPPTDGFGPSRLKRGVSCSIYWYRVAGLTVDRTHRALIKPFRPSTLIPSAFSSLQTRLVPRHSPRLSPDLPRHHLILDSRTASTRPPSSQSSRPTVGKEVPTRPPSPSEPVLDHHSFLPTDPSRPKRSRTLPQTRPPNTQAEAYRRARSPPRSLSMRTAPTTPRRRHSSLHRLRTVFAPGSSANSLSFLAIPYASLPPPPSPPPPVPRPHQRRAAAAPSPRTPPLSAPPTRSSASDAGWDHHDHDHAHAGRRLSFCSSAVSTASASSRFELLLQTRRRAGRSAREVEMDEERARFGTGLGVLEPRPVGVRGVAVEGIFEVLGGRA